MKYVITLEPMPSPVPAIVRIKAALKLFGRRFAMRCVDIRQSDAPGSPAAAETPRQSYQDAGKTTLVGQTTRSNAAAVLPLAK